MTKKLTLIDGNSLLFRAYYATVFPGAPIMSNKEGYPTNAVFAFANMINKILSTLKYDEYIMVAFDTDRKTFRTDIYKEYKANRSSVPEDLVKQFPLARTLLDALGIFRYEIKGYEADDIIGTISSIASKENFETTIYTSDRDYLQLVDKNTTVNILKKGLSDIMVMTPESVKETYGFEPLRIIDYKGLRGDPSDNLPGIPGVGDKTAVKLINEYNTLENIIEAAKAMTSKVGQNIVENAKIGLICRDLAIINREVPIEFTLNDLKYDGYDFTKINNFAQQYELRQFLNRLPKKWKRTNPLEEDVEVKEIKTLSDIKLGEEISISIDIDPNEEYFKAEIYGFALSDGKNVYYIALVDALKDENFKNMLADEQIKKYVYNAKMIEVAIHKYGLKINGIKGDILLAAYLIDSALNSTDIVNVMASFGVDVSNDDSNLTLFDNQDIKRSGKIAIATFALKDRIDKELKNIHALELYENIELPLSHVLAKMEIEGFPLDKECLDKFGNQFKDKIKILEEEIYALAGTKFNIASPKQLAEILFVKLGLPDRKNGSTGQDILKDLLPNHPIIEKVIEYRKYAKLNSTYVEGFKPHIYSDGKIHALFNQAQTTTGRLSSSSPNLQNISVRDEEGKQIRKAFYYKDEDYLILSLDYSQIELRILAALSHSKPLIEIFNNNEDIHESTAKKVFKKDVITSDERRKAKAVNFGIIYGISDWGLSEQINTSVKEARDIINSFFEAFQDVALFLRQIVLEASKEGYVSTLFGRRRYLRDFNSSNYQTREFAKRAAMNAPIQGTAADLIKIAMINVDKLLEDGNYKTKMVLQIHDELIFKIHKDEIDSLLPLIKQTMENVKQIGVPLVVEGGCGKTFFDAK